MCVPQGGYGRKTPSEGRWGYHHTPVEAITKAEVDEIIDSGEFKCYYKRGDDSDFKEYDGCLTNLTNILHDGKTRVKVAGSATEGFHLGCRTVVMKAPCVNATILIRTAL